MIDRKKSPVKWLTTTAVFMALSIALSSSIFSIPVPGGHFYINDIVITTAAILFDPLAAFVVGGIGAFIGDALFYPAPMFVSLVTHGIQAVVISLCVHKFFKNKETVGAVIGVILGIIINVVGYSLGRAFIYSTPEYAITKLPFQILQAALSIVAPIICYKLGLKKVFERLAKSDR